VACDSVFCSRRSFNACIDPREYCISTKEFLLDEQGKLSGLNTGACHVYSGDLTFISWTLRFTVRVEWTKDSGGRWKMEEVLGSEKFFPAQLVFLALGFLGPQPEAITALSVKQDARSNIQTPPKKYSTNVEGVYAAGDCRRGQSLIVWGIK
jgi:glutamate synthase (NADPH/NADH)